MGTSIGISTAIVDCLGALNDPRATEFNQSLGYMRIILNRKHSAAEITEMNDGYMFEPNTFAYLANARQCFQRLQILCINSLVAMMVARICFDIRETRRREPITLVQSDSSLMEQGRSALVEVSSA